MPSKDNGVIGSAVSSAHPSLALIKYWGKQDGTRNIPATPSLAVTLDGLTTKTRVDINRPVDGREEPDRVFLEGILQREDRFAPFFTGFRKLTDTMKPGMGRFIVTAHSSSDFPTASGLASSASGFAALSCACAAAADLELSAEELSAMARIGSASAARSIYGGFTRLDAGSLIAEPLYGENWWPDFRIIVLELEKGPKNLSSRQAMERTRLNSPYYQAWIDDSELLMDRSLDALRGRDLDALGPLIRNSYLRMFATMFAADPPIIYWKPISLAIIQLCDIMRSEGFSIWETMDAGPQVKLFCLKNDVKAIRNRLIGELNDLNIRICRPGGPPSVQDRSET